MLITADISIEELVNQFPQSVKFLSEKGIRCIRCGEPIWGTLYSAAQEKGFSEAEISALLKDLNNLLNV